MATHANRLPVWRQAFAWLTARDVTVDVDRIARDAEQWAQEAKVDRLVSRLAAARGVPGACVDPDWRKTCGCEQPPNRAGDV